MTKRRLFVIGSVAVWLILLAIITITSLNRLSAAPWGNPVGEQVTAKIAGDTRVGQRFTAPLAGLHAVEVMLVREPTGSTLPIVFHLKASPEATQDLWNTELSTDEIQQDISYRFEFAPLPGSRGQEFYFYLESPESQPGNAAAALYSPESRLEGASAYLDDRPVAGNLQFQTHYALRTREKVDLLLSRMAEGRPYLLGTKGFYIVLAVAYAVTLGLFMLHVARIVIEEQKEET
jgi:hypothetical protein